MDGIFISRQTFQEFSSSTRDEILQSILGKGDNIDISISANAVESRWGMNHGQAEKFISGCSDTTRRALKKMVDDQNESGNFTLPALAVYLETDEKKLKGIWTGLTRRIRSLTGDKDAYLIAWGYRPENQDEWYGTIVPQQTFDAFRRIFLGAT